MNSKIKLRLLGSVLIAGLLVFQGSVLAVGTDVFGATCTPDINPTAVPEGSCALVAGLDIVCQPVGVGATNTCKIVAIN